MSAIENAELLAIDALYGPAPELWLVLTTPSTETRQAVFRSARRRVKRAIRQRWPHARCCWVMEMTSGYGPRSSGERRPHWNVLVKGPRADELEELRSLAVSAWCSTDTRSVPSAQFAGAIGDASGLMRYLALHFLKESQTPPLGWRGQRVTMDAGYLWTATPDARAEARASLRFKRELWKAERRGLAGDELHAAVAAAVELADATTWTFRPGPVLWDDGDQAQLQEVRAQAQLEHADRDQLDVDVPVGSTGDELVEAFWAGRDRGDW